MEEKSSNFILDAIIDADLAANPRNEGTHTFFRPSPTVIFT